MARDAPTPTRKGGVGFSDTSKGVENFLGGSISNTANYDNATLPAFYPGEHVQPQSLDIDSGINVSIN